ncbi:hypothetical protein MCOR04_002021 [Pyricularia oryzae]|nr:hypothetical protein MCOR04_002021 [Pyricularia oryzae]
MKGSYRHWRHGLAIVNWSFFRFMPRILEVKSRKQKGILRAILLQLLRRKPQYISRVFPERWAFFRGFGIIPPPISKGLDRGQQNSTHPSNEITDTGTAFDSPSLS